MKITPFGIIFAVLAIVAIIYIWERLRQDLLGVRSAVIWLFLWFFVGFFSLFPDLLNVAMRVAQMENRMSFVLLHVSNIINQINTARNDAKQEKSQPNLQEIRGRVVAVESEEQSGKHKQIFRPLMRPHAPH